MLAASFQPFIMAALKSLTAQSPIRFLPRSRTVPRRVSLHQQLYPPGRISRLALRIELHRRRGHPFPLDAGEQH